MMRFLSLLSAAVIFSSSVMATGSVVPRTESQAASTEKVVFESFDTSVNDGETIRGVDVSSIIAIEKAGVKFYNSSGQEQDIFRTLSENGVNYIRVRVWNEPYDSSGNSYGGGNNDLYTAAEIGKRAAKYGMKLLVDIQYSDFWADPEKQTRPKYWQQHDHETLKGEIYKYTKWVLETVSEAGGKIGMVQVGNETNCFFCGEKDMYKICDLFASGNKAVRDFDRSILIAHHFANPSTGYYDWYAKVMDECRLDYDVFATSYYPYWHGTTDNLTKVLKGIADKYGKYVMVAETAYPYTNDDGDTFGNAVSQYSDNVDLRYPISVDGQAQCLTDVFRAVANVGSKGLGVFYWEPAWLGVYGLSWNEQSELWKKYGSGWATEYAAEYDKSVNGAGGSSYDNQALFDFTGKPLASLSVFNNIYPRKEPEFPHDPIQGSVIPEGSYRIKNLNSELYLTLANGNSEAGTNVIQYEADGAAFYNTWNFKSDENGYYRIYSDAANGNSLMLDLDAGKHDNKTNIGVYTDTMSDAQKFKLLDNGDGTYTILTKSTNDRSAVEIADANGRNGGNAQQYELNGHNCQKWILEPVEPYSSTGDLDGDGCIDVFDLVYLRRQVMNKTESKAADINGDSSVDISDIVSLQSYLLGRKNITIREYGTPPNTIFPEI